MYATFLFALSSSCFWYDIVAEKDFIADVSSCYTGLLLFSFDVCSHFFYDFKWWVGRDDKKENIYVNLNKAPIGTINITIPIEYIINKHPQIERNADKVRNNTRIRTS